MAGLVREVNDINSIGGNDFIIELEYIKFVDNKGNSRKFKIFGILPVSTAQCKEFDKECDWDESNFHFVVDVSEELKEV